MKVRLKGPPSQTSTFDRLTDAKKWVQDTESAIREGWYFVTAEAKKRTLRDLIARYRSDVLRTLTSRSARAVHFDWWEQELGAYILADFRPSLLIEVRKRLSEKAMRRGTPISNSTINHYNSNLIHAFTVAMKEWQWVDDNPFRKIKTLKEPEGVVAFHYFSGSFPQYFCPSMTQFPVSIAQVR